MDLRKAFDVIEHAILISKLSKRRVSDNELAWFKSHLPERNQFESFASADNDMEIHASAKDVSVVKNRVKKDLASTVSWWNQNGFISNHKKCEAILNGSKHAVKNT